MWHDLDFWRTVNLGAAALGQTFFVLLYASFPWWRTFLGRALFYKALILMALTDFVVVARVLDFTGEDVLFVWIYGLLAVGIWWQALAFLSIKKQGGKKFVSDARRTVRQDDSLPPEARERDLT